MDPKQAEEQATQLARDVVAKGFASQEAVRKAYFEYVELVRKQGVRGTFAQLLAARNIVDRDKIAQITGVRPPSDRVSGVQGSLASSPGATTPAPPSIPGTDDGEEGGGVTMKITPEALQAQLADAAKRRATGAGSTPSATALPGQIANPMARSTPSATALPGTIKMGPTPSSRPGNLVGASTPQPPANTPRPANTPAPTPAALTPPPPAYTPPSVTSSSARHRAAPGVTRAATTPAPPPPGISDAGPNDDSGPDLAIPGSADLEPGAPPQKLVAPDELLPSREEDPHRKSAMETQDDEQKAVKALLAAGNLDDDDEEEELEGVPSVELVGTLAANGEPQAGCKIGPYEIVSLLGRGGMAAVFRVKDTRADSELAMKVLTGGDRPGAEKRRARFLREVRAVQKLDHPNIVKIRENGRCGPLDFYVMDLVEGEDFEKALAKKKFEVDKRLEIVEGICRAMAHAHERGVIHRDLKPQNVLLDGRNKPRVVDFGLAKVKDDEVSLTRTNTALGTPFYMAPEQHKNAKGIDQRADVFALGCIIYECATGVRPFSGETAAEVGHKVLTLDPPLPSKLAPGKVTPQIDAIVVKALEKDPQRRYASAGALLVDLIRARSGKELVGARGALGLGATIRKLYEKNRGAVVGGAVVAGLMVPVLAFVAYKASASTNTPKPSKHTDDDTGDKPGDKPGDKKPGDKKPGDKKPTGRETPKPPTPPPPPPPPPPAPPPTPPPPQGGPPSPPPPPPPPPPGAPPPPPNTEKPATAWEIARGEIKIAEEGRDAAADVLLKAFAPEQGLAFATAYERHISVPLARGDVNLAKEGLTALGNDAEVLSFPPLAKDELQHDLDAIQKLRRYVVERLKGDTRSAPQTLDAFDSSRQLRGPIKLVDDDCLELQSEKGRVVLDPLALSMNVLRALTRDDPPAAKYAVAVLGLHRGEEVRNDLKALVDKLPAASHRIAWIDALKQFRTDGGAVLERQADEAWKPIDADRAKAKVGNPESVEKRILEFVKTYGRFEPYRSRRPDIMRCARETVLFDKLSAAVAEEKKKNFFDFRWHLDRPKHSKDFEVIALDKTKPFKAEKLADGIFIENATLALDLGDRGASQVAVDFTSPENEPVTLLAGDKLVEFDPKGEVRLCDEHASRLKTEKAKNYNVRSNHTLTLFRTEDPTGVGLLARLNKDDLLRWPFPKGQENRAPMRPNRVGLLTTERARVTTIEASIARAAGQNKELENRFHERDLVEARAEALAKTARLLCDGTKGHELVFENEWRTTANGHEGTGPASLTTLRETADGVATFDLQLDDGPGAIVELGRAGSPVAKWVLPAASSKESRKVSIVFELGRNGGTATCVLDDAVRLETALKVSAGQVGIRIVLVGRTRGTVKNLRLVELSRAPR